MGPLYAVVVLLHKVGLTLFARAYRRVLQVEVTAEFVAFDVLRTCRHLPRAEGVDTTTYGEVHMLAEGKVVAEVADKEALGIFAVCGHQNTRLRTCADGEEGLRNTWKVDGYILHYEVRVASDNLLAWEDLCACHREVEVGVVHLVAGGVHTVANVYRLVGVHLHATTHQPAVALLCGNTLNLRLA